MKKIIISSIVLAIAGAVTTAGFLVASGLQYRDQEEQGLEPGYTPAPIVLGIEIGLWAFGIGALIFAVAGTIALLRRAKRNAAPPNS
ncbi:hypothetical protein [Plantibacter sp. CFBP 8775]|uniref:hypothetical protein n=1 Tax=Plantibacter sp. CFBP 8775 TaxID=2774038 RepID=UPI00177B74AF|nr:hypothetical protein [Plantibacter sp. CFBP 8775]MBD8104779.1 hypothetical protein [Plantibacter sp. CFBP 8775]